LRLDCGSVGGTIKTIQFASFGRSSGGCGSYGINPTCNSGNSVSVLTTACVGKASCSVTADNTVFGGDPCFSDSKWLNVQVQCSAATSISATVSVPTNKQATVAIPLLTLTQAVLKESAGPVWTNGQYQSGVPGISGASIDSKTNTLRVEVNSGNYSFMLTGAEGTHICAQGAENATLTLTCPANTAITRVNFASYGNSTSTCGNVLTRGLCYAGSGKAVVERLCVGKSSCQVQLLDTVFGDPCYGTAKGAVVEVICAKN